MISSSAGNGNMFTSFIIDGRANKTNKYIDKRGRWYVVNVCGLCIGFGSGAYQRLEPGEIFHGLLHETVKFTG